MTDRGGAQCPEWMSATGRAKWGELCASFDFRPTELDSVAAYCAAYSRWVESEQWLASPEHGPVATIRDDKGHVKSHSVAPQVLVGERAGREMARLAKLLGLARRTQKSLPRAKAAERKKSGRPKPAAWYTD